MEKIPFYLALMIVAVIFLASCTAQPLASPVVKAHSLKINEEGDRDVVSFTLKNFNNVSANCFASVLLKGQNVSENLTLSVGHYAPMEERKESFSISMPVGKTKVFLTPFCTWLSGNAADEFPSIMNEAVERKSTEPCNRLFFEEKPLCELIMQHNAIQCADSNRTLADKFFCVAILSVKPEVCSYIADDASRYHCLAYMKSNVSICDQITDALSRDWCLQDLGINWRNADICNTIKSIDKKASCLAIVQENADACVAVQNPEDKYLCIVNIAANKRNTGICDALADETTKAKCRQEASAASI